MRNIFHALLDKILHTNGLIVLIGDLNINLLNDYSISSGFEAMYKLEQLIR